MANGRCRLHGGKSTGPRTAAGIERCRTARWQHGMSSQEALAEKRRLRVLLHEADGLIRDLREAIRLGTPSEPSLSASTSRTLRSNFKSMIERALSAIDEALKAKIIVVSKTGAIIDAGPDHNVSLAAVGSFIKLLRMMRQIGAERCCPSTRAAEKGLQR